MGDLTLLHGSAIVASLVANQVNLFSASAYTRPQESASSTAWWWYWRSTEEAIALA
jgi:hypothetical protein